MWAEIPWQARSAKRRLHRALSIEHDLLLVPAGVPTVAHDRLAGDEDVLHLGRTRRVDNVREPAGRGGQRRVATVQHNEIGGLPRLQ